jgi:N-acetylglucosaminyldiphosphoundecaprenol N-acetyl-beta-D-mannosaminyltransferase
VCSSDLPAWIQKHNLEWAYRYAQNPKRLKRIGALPGFLLAVRRQEKSIYLHI